MSDRTALLWLVYGLAVLAFGAFALVRGHRLTKRLRDLEDERTRIDAALACVPPPRPPPPAPSVERWHADADPLARAILGDGASDAQIEAARDLVALAHQRGWTAGVVDLRAALVEGSGLPPAMADYAAGLALGRLEGR